MVNVPWPAFSPVLYVSNRGRRKSVDGAMNERMGKRKRSHLTAKGLLPCKKLPRYFHGGNFGLQIGEYILPPSKTGVPQNGDVSPDIRRAAAQIGGLACCRFHPWQRGMIFIDAIEIDERLASHLVGSDPFLCDQLISFRLSELSITTPVLKLGEPAALVVVVVSHGS